MAKQDKTNKCAGGMGWIGCGILGAALFAGGIAIGHCCVKKITPGANLPESHAQNLAEPTCNAVERLLTERIDQVNPNSLRATEHVIRAEMYSNLAKRACEENKDSYQDLALKELEIARALTNDSMEYNTGLVRETVRVYKDLEMRKEAEKFFESAKRLIDPAMDFIAEVESIINEK